MVVISQDDWPQKRGRVTPSRNRTESLICSLGRISYPEALNLQANLRDRCADHEIPGILLLLEHDPVITIGVKLASEKNILASGKLLEERGVAVINTDRGGDVTYHGPGQLVGYPIYRLRELTGDLHGYLRSLEDSIILTLAEFGLKGERNGPAGVWVGNKKVCSIGIAVRKWVTYHGFALNVDPDIEHFSLINPCGLDSQEITSMAGLLGNAPAMDSVRDAFTKSFAEVFNLSFTPWCPD